MVVDKQSPQARQSGIALLFLVVAIALTLSAYYFSQVSIVKIEADKVEKTRAALKEAKRALLGYAVARADLTAPLVLSPQAGRYGFLPCPANGFGTSVGTCEGIKENALGWFPWRSLKVAPIKDGNEDCLLYAVSGSYKFWQPTGMLNEDTNGMFQIVDDENNSLTGAQPQDRVVAVIFSAGGALAGQTRTYQVGTECGNHFDVNSLYLSNYLDPFEVSPGVIVDNSAMVTNVDDEVYQFVQANITVSKGVFNDQLITITRDEVWSAITARNDFIVKMSNLTEAMAICLSKYAAANDENRLPWPAPMNLADYRPDDNYDDAIPNPVVGLGYAGRFPFKVTDSNARIGIVGADLLFTDAVCNNLVLPPDTITVDGEILTRGGITVDLLGGASDEYVNLWKNWKDHFFYVVSQAYEPMIPLAPPVLASCGNCITVNGTNRAATVIFAGSRQGGQVRNDPPDDTKQLIANYLENGNQTIFPDITGNGTYVIGGNDIMFCIAPGLGVSLC